MIHYISGDDAELAGAFMEASELEPASGARLQTLYNMYRGKTKHMDFWVQLDFRGQPSAAVSRYGGQLSVTHGPNSDLDELEEFVRFIGGYSFISASPSLAVMLKDLGDAANSYKMVRKAALFPDDDFDLIAKPSLSDVFELLCIADESFKERSDRASWHVHTSHLVRHKFGYCVGIIREDGKLISTGGVYNTGISHGIIGGIATLPSERGHGYSGVVCRYLANQIILDRKVPALFSATESLAVYYESMGFEEKGRWCEIAVREVKADRRE